MHSLLTVVFQSSILLSINYELCYKCFLFPSSRFVFRISLASTAASAHPMSIAFAVRFHCAGQQFWDNNGGNNYTADYFPPAHVVSPPSASES